MGPPWDLCREELDRKMQTIIRERDQQTSDCERLERIVRHKDTECNALKDHLTDCDNKIQGLISESNQLQEEQLILLDRISDYLFLLNILMTRFPADTTFKLVLGLFLGQQSLENLNTNLRTTIETLGLCPDKIIKDRNL